MFGLSQLNEIQIILFGLIFLRMSGFIFTSAVFNSTQISTSFKVLFPLLLSLVLFKTIVNNNLIVQYNEMQIPLLYLSVKEILIGVSLGFVTRLFFFVISIAGEIISVAMGLGQAQLYNPMMGTMGNVMEQFFVVLATLIFLTINGHHAVLEALNSSFQYINVVTYDFKINHFLDIVLIFQNLFIFGIKISAPILVSMLVIQVGVGILSRAVPQINVFMTSAPITIIIGFGVLFISLPLMVMQMNGLLSFSMDQLFQLIKKV